MYNIDFIKYNTNNIIKYNTNIIKEFDYKVIIEKLKLALNDKESTGDNINHTEAYPINDFSDDISNISILGTGGIIISEEGEFYSDKISSNNDEAAINHTADPIEYKLYLDEDGYEINNGNSATATTTLVEEKQNAVCDNLAYIANDNDAWQTLTGYATDLKNFLISDDAWLKISFIPLMLTIGYAARKTYKFLSTYCEATLDALADDAMPAYTYDLDNIGIGGNGDDIV
jgi:hypothetical protein